MSKWLARARSETAYRSDVPIVPLVPIAPDKPANGTNGTIGTPLLQSEEGILSALAGGAEIEEVEIPISSRTSDEPSIPAAYWAAYSDLCASCPAGVPFDRWRQAVEDAERFLAEWGETAERLGWTARDLFDLHETVPLSRMDRMGLVWLLKGERVTLLTETAARFERGLTFYKPPRARAAP